jgi:hypothetical protein
VGVLLWFRAIAITVLEINSKIFNGFAAQFLHYPVPNPGSQIPVPAEFTQADGRGESSGVPAIFFKCTEGKLSKPDSCVGLEKVRAPINGVYRLPLALVARVLLHDLLVYGTQASVKFLNRF